MCCCRQIKPGVTLAWRLVAHTRRSAARYNQSAAEWYAKEVCVGIEDVRHNMTTPPVRASLGTPHGLRSVGAMYRGAACPHARTMLRRSFTSAFIIADWRGAAGNRQGAAQRRRSAPDDKITAASSGRQTRKRRLSARVPQAKCEVADSSKSIWAWSAQPARSSPGAPRRCERRMQVGGATQTGVLTRRVSACVASTRAGTRYNASRVLCAVTLDRNERQAHAALSRSSVEQLPHGTTSEDGSLEHVIIRYACTGAAAPAATLILSRTACPSRVCLRDSMRA